MRVLCWMVGVAHAPLPGLALFLNLRDSRPMGWPGLASHCSFHRHLSPYHLQARARKAKPVGWLPSVRNVGARVQEALRVGAPGSAVVGVFRLRGEECLTALQPRAKGQWPRRCHVVMAGEMSGAQPGDRPPGGRQACVCVQTCPPPCGPPFPPGGDLSASPYSWALPTSRRAPGTPVRSSPGSAGAICNAV